MAPGLRVIFVDEAPRHETSGGKRRVGTGESGFVAVESAMFVAERYAGTFQQSGDSQLVLAIAGLGDLRSVGAADDAHSHSVAFGAGLGHEGVSLRVSQLIA